MQVTEHVHAIRIDYVAKPKSKITVKRFVYAYVVCGEKVHLIDAGIASSVGTIFEYLASIGRDTDEIETVVLTHAHPDHMGGLKLIQDLTWCRVFAHAQERVWVEDPSRQSADRHIPGFEQMITGPARIDRLVDEGERIALEPGLDLAVYHTPGHSPGSISLHLESEKVLWTGDVMAFAWGIPVYEDVRALVGSIKKLHAIQPVEVLLNSWDQPRQGDEVDRVFTDSLRYLQRIHETVGQHMNDPNHVDPMTLCHSVFETLNLPLVSINPVAAQSLMAHIPLLDCSDITTL